MSVEQQLINFQSSEKFPLSEWKERGLNSSSEKTIVSMNQEVNEFIEFVLSISENKKDKQISQIQTWIDDWDDFAFDTEETEFMLDKMVEATSLAGLDSKKLIL